MNKMLYMHIVQKNRSTNWSFLKWNIVPI